mgnify:CR=1 FL=1
MAKGFGDELTRTSGDIFREEIRHEKALRPDVTRGGQCGHAATMSRPVRLGTEIIDTKVLTDNKSKEFVSYQIRVRCNDLNWLIEKRYREFSILNDELTRLDAMQGLSATIFD